VSKIIHEDIDDLAERLKANWKDFEGKRFLITGAGGFLGKYMVLLLKSLNQKHLKQKCSAVLLDNFVTGYDQLMVSDEDLTFRRQDVTKPFDIEKLLLCVDRLMLEKFNIIKKETEYMLISIKALVKALEARDGYTKGHTDRVAQLSMELGRYMKLDDNTLENIEIAASLHDIGKIGVRDDLLLKEGKLTDKEYVKIQEHAILGAEILKPIQSLKEIIPLILYHHEKWNGTGYPYNIRETEIPLGARIIAIADAFDAMTSDRPYREKMSMEKALKILKNNSGTQFCPECTAAFIEMVETGAIA